MYAVQSIIRRINAPGTAHRQQYIMMYSCSFAASAGHLPWKNRGKDKGEEEPEQVEKSDNPVKASNE